MATVAPDPNYASSADDRTCHRSRRRISSRLRTLPGRAGKFVPFGHLPPDLTLNPDRHLTPITVTPTLPPVTNCDINNLTLTLNSNHNTRANKCFQTNDFVYL